MAIYNGTQKINMSGIGKVYVGSQLVYQKQLPPEWHTIYTGSSTSTSTSTLNYVKSKGSTSYVNKNPFVTLTNTTNPIKLRLTIKYTNYPSNYGSDYTDDNYYTYYKNHQVTADDFNTHTITITLDDIDPVGVSAGAKELFAINSYLQGEGSIRTTGLILGTSFQLYVQIYKGESSAYSEFWITKVEQYY